MNLRPRVWDQWSFRRESRSGPPSYPVCTDQDLRAPTVSGTTYEGGHESASPSLHFLSVRNDTAGSLRPVGTGTSHVPSLYVPLAPTWVLVTLFGWRRDPVGDHPGL